MRQENNILLAIFYHLQSFQSLKIWHSCVWQNINRHTTHVFPFPKWGLRKSFEGINLKPVYFFIWFLKSTETNEVVVWKTGLWLKSNNVLWLTEIKCMIKTCLTSLILDVKSKQTLFNLLYSLYTGEGNPGVTTLLKAEVNKPRNIHKRYLEEQLSLHFIHV